VGCEVNASEVRNLPNNQDKKELLARCAIDLFAKKGYSLTSIRDIARAAKVNIALIYYYFKDKEAVLCYVIERAARDLLVMLKEIQTNEPDPLECLKKMIIRQVLYSSQSWKETKVIIADSGLLHGQYKKDCQRLEREIYEVYMGQLERLRDANLLVDVDLAVANFSISGMINWFYRWYRQGQPLNEEAVANEMIKILFYGLLKKSKDD
jgi:AcrR family transcriptional regulator